MRWLEIVMALLIGGMLAVLVVVSCTRFFLP
jgi:hypothetical protein